MYYHLQGNSITLTTYTDPINQTYDSLVLGRTIDEKFETLPYIYTYYDPVGNPIPDFFDGDNIMGVKMYNVLKQCGIDNIQALPLKFIDKETEKVRDDYIVFNIIGLVSCAKVDESETSSLGAGYYFHDLVIGPDKVHDLIFRVKESLIDIVVHEKVAKALEENDILGITLTPATKS
jgi:hypothetical protein